MDNLATALALLGGGWTPVPLNPPGPKGKQPIGKWMDLQSCPPTEVEVCEWLYGTSRNVGIVTGRASGVVVIDVDDRDELAKLRQRGLPPTIATTTAKGMHLFFAAPAFEVTAAPRSSRPCLSPGGRTSVRARVNLVRDSKR